MSFFPTILLVLALSSVSVNVQARQISIESRVGDEHAATAAVSRFSLVTEAAADDGNGGGDDAAAAATTTAANPNNCIKPPQFACPDLWRLAGNGYCLWFCLANISNVPPANSSEGYVNAYALAVGGVGFRMRASAPGVSSYVCPPSLPRRIESDDVDGVRYVYCVTTRVPFFPNNQPSLGPYKYWDSLVLGYSFDWNQPQ